MQKVAYEEIYLLYTPQLYIYEASFEDYSSNSSLSSAQRMPLDVGRLGRVLVHLWRG